MTDPHTTPIISAIVCTYRRPAYLNKALASLVDQSLPANRYEVIVVDNAGDEETRALTERYADLGPVSYIAESKVGLVWARNTGLSRAAGEYVAYLDDDAVASPGWLEALVDAFTAGGPAVAAAGGPIDLIWESPRPAWLVDGLLAPLGHLDHGSVACTLRGGEWLYGGNMAFRTSTLQDVGGFHAGLGRAGDKGHLLSNEEVFVQHRLADLGHARTYSPDATVHHHVAPDRVNPRWFESRYYWQGVSEAVLTRLLQRLGVAQLLKNAARDGRTLLRDRRHMAALVQQASRRGDPEGLATRCAALHRAGRVRGWLTPLPLR